MPVRPATVDDLESINNLLGQLGGYDNTHAFLREKLPDFLSDIKHYLFIYEENETVMGLISPQKIFELGIEKNTMLITYLVVNDEYRSSGVGKKLEQHCRELAISENCGRIQLHCHFNRERAHDFYRSLGYIESPKYFTKTL